MIRHIERERLYGVTREAALEAVFRYLQPEGPVRKTRSSATTSSSPPLFAIPRASPEARRDLSQRLVARWPTLGPDRQRGLERLK